MFLLAQHSVSVLFGNLPRLITMTFDLLEPVGFKAPSFPSVASTFTIQTPQNSELALTCEAQSYPVPIFR